MSSAACPFVLASAREVHVAQGLRRMVTAARSADLPDRVRRLLTDADRDESVAPVVVGALPFSAGAQPHVFQPDRWARRLPTSNVHAPWPAAPGRQPERWTVRAVPP